MGSPLVPDDHCCQRAQQTALEQPPSLHGEFRLQRGASEHQPIPKTLYFNIFHPYFTICHPYFTHISPIFHPIYPNFPKYFVFHHISPIFHHISPIFHPIYPNFPKYFVFHHISPLPCKISSQSSQVRVKYGEIQKIKAQSGWEVTAMYLWSQWSPRTVPVIEIWPKYG